MTLDVTRALDESDFPDGSWTGFDQDEGQALRQDLHLTFAGGLVTGIGIDRVGEFVVDGRYDRGSHEVVLTKSYPGRPDRRPSSFRGYREVHGIWGLEDGGGAGSGFHIWPVTECAASSELQVAAAPGGDALPSWLFRI